MHSVNTCPKSFKISWQPKSGATGAQLRDRARHWPSQSPAWVQALPASRNGV
jgi:hypothetical protein